MWVIFSLSTMIYFIFVVVLRKIIFSKKIKPVFTDYKKIEFNVNNSTDHGNIFRIIADNYTDPELSVERTAELSNTDLTKISNTSSIICLRSSRVVFISQTFIETSSSLLKLDSSHLSK